jgi:dTDP-4-dehydrorhamnose 3,5-epimerase
MIAGAQEKRLRVIPDDRGYLFEILRCDDEIFEEFGQAYITACYPGVVKAWHAHSRQDDFFCCVDGMAKVVLYDARDDSPTRGEIQEFFMGDRNPALLKIPSGVYHGFTALGTGRCLILNIPTRSYDRESPDELRLPWDTPEIPYDWMPQNR